MNCKLKNNKIYNKIKINKYNFIFENFNKKVWNYNLLLYFKNHPDILKKIQQINKNSDSKKEILSILGNNFKYNINKIYSFFKI